MQRRNFLKGLLISASATAGTALVKLAEPGEARALAVQQETLIGQPEVLTGLPDIRVPEVYMRDAHGQLVCVGLLTSVDLSAHMVDATRFDAEFRVYEQGMKSAVGRFEGFW